MPQTSAIDEHWMRIALAKARESVALASPNPAVGCVLVRYEEIVGEGCHIYDQLDHAEVVALKQAGPKAANSTAYVTLEPCSHQGRTGPCADALIRAGVARVVAATLDPNPQVSGQGIAKLRAAGVDTAIGVCQQQARALNNAFARFIQTGQPFVTLKAALSLDGKLAPPPRMRQPNTPHWLTGRLARAEVQRLRHASDAVLTGIGTVLADDPSLTDRTGLARRRPLLRVVLDSHLRLPINSRLVRSAQRDLLVFGNADAAPENLIKEKQSALEAQGVRVERIANDHASSAASNTASSVAAKPSGNCIDLRRALGRLAELQIASVLLEGGSRVNGAFLRQKLVDKLVLFYAPIEFGQDAVPFTDSIASPFLLQQELRQAANEDFGPDACISGLLRDPWPPV